MQLHQLLRFVSFTTPVCILDIQGIEICKVFNKNDIDLDLYEYPVLQINSSILNLKGYPHGLCITIQK